MSKYNDIRKYVNRYTDSKYKEMKDMIEVM